MRRSKLVTDVRFTQASPSEVRQGLVGYLSFVVGNAIRVDGVTLRMTAAQRPALSYPCRTDKRGHKHPLAKAADADSRIQIESEVFAALGIDPEGGLGGI